MRPSEKFQNKSPEISVRAGIETQDHVDVRTSLQVTRKRENVCEVVKNTGWCSRTIVKDTQTDQMAPG
jgi:hypothetical protein